MKEYIKFVALIIAGLVIITIACIVIFHIFPAPSGSKGYDAALAIAGTVMFWVALAGIVWGLSWIIKKFLNKFKSK
jgi:uncharacterized membrane protein YphA (DoxX/SURF4 family)